jgi:hypothetical protein
MWEPRRLATLRASMACCRDIALPCDFIPSRRYYEDCCPPGCSAVQSGREARMFGMNVQPPSSLYHSEVGDKLETHTQLHGVTHQKTVYITYVPMPWL